MSWFMFALICLLGWGFADLFYKLGTDESDRYSHLKIAVWVGLVMGVCALILIPFSESFAPGAEEKKGFFVSAVKYAPASLCYIISMVIGYAGLRYLEMSIVSPVQNASGGMSAIVMFVFFSIKGTTEEIGTLDLIGTVLIVAGVIWLAIEENRLSRREIAENAQNRKYRFGALALIFPLLYCLFDTIGTSADGIILDEEHGLGLGEIDVLVLYGLTFMLAGLGAWIFLRVKTGKFYNPFAKSEKYKCVAALCEEAGQVFYVYAMAKNPVVAAPMVASYCIVSVILSRLIVKEKLDARRYLCVITVIAGIVLLGISEGLGEREEAEELAQESAGVLRRIKETASLILNGSMW